MDGVSNTTAAFPEATTNIANNGALDCNAYKRLDYEIGLLILNITMGLFGLVYTFVGYRCFKAVMFLSGFIFGGTVVYVICQEEKIVTHNLSPNTIIGISIGIAVLCGLITMLVVYVGLFLQGFFLGLLIAIGAILALSKFYHPSTPWIPFGILFGTGILFILFTLKWQKTFLIIGTSIMGAALICSCLQYFLGKFSLHRYIWVNLMAEQHANLCWFFPIILGLWPGLALIGIIIQWKFTGKDFHHTDGNRTTVREFVAFFFNKALILTTVIIRRDQSRIRTHLVRYPTISTGTRQRNASRRNRTRRTTGGQQQQRRRRTDMHVAHEITRPPNSGTGRSQAAAPRNSARATSTDHNFDTLPPSYDDCVIRGVGKPVTDEDQQRIIRTEQGSYLSPHDNPSFTGNTSSTDRQGGNAGPAPGAGGTPNFVPGRRRRQSGRGNNHRPSPSDRNGRAGRSGRVRDGGQRSSSRGQRSSSRARPRASIPQTVIPAEDRESLLRT